MADMQFINTPEGSRHGVRRKIGGALRGVAASDVKVQVEFNPNQCHGLSPDRLRQASTDQGTISRQHRRRRAESARPNPLARFIPGEVNPAGDGPLCTVRVRFRRPGTTDYQEHAWDVPYTGTSVALDQASPAMRLAAARLRAFQGGCPQVPMPAEVTPDQLLADACAARPRNL